MPDAATVCYSGVDNSRTSVSGRTVSRTKNSRTFSTDPKINRQLPSSGLDTKYTTRFDDLHYYY